MNRLKWNQVMRMTLVEYVIFQEVVKTSAAGASIRFLIPCQHQASIEVER